MSVLTGWCSAIGTDAWVSSRAVNPCLLETGTALAVLLALLITVIQSAGPLKHAHAHRKEGTREKGPIGISGGELGLILGTLFVGGIHAMHLVAVVSGWSPPFHTFFHTTMLVTWVLFASAVIFTSKVHVVLDLRVTTFVALIGYVLLLETYWSLYRIVDAFPLQYVRSLIWSLMLQSVVTLLLVVLDWKRHKVVRAPAGYQPIPDGVPTAPDHDPEAATKDAGTFQPLAPAAGAAAPLPRAGSSPEIDPNARLSWLTIFWDSCVAVWPEKRSLQLRVLLAFILLMIMRVLNLAVPILYKKLVDSLAAVSARDGGASEAWVLWGWLSPWILFYLIAIFFQGGAGGGMVGAINNLRQVLWIPVSQDAYRRISLRIFGHVLGLDLNFHLGRKTGEVTKQIDRGTNAMQNILSTILFSIVPTCIDVLTASTYLAQALEPSVAVTVFLTVGSYIPVTILITEWRGALRREMNQTDQAMSARVTDALLNYETVHYFTNEAHEAQQYEKAIDDYQRAEFKAMASVNLLNSVQSMIMWVGISIGLLVCSAGVHRGDLTVGDVVLFLQLMAQLYGPLNWFGSYYRVMQQYTIDMENLFQLLDKKSQIEDRPDAKELVVRDGKVEYDSVWFQYEGRAPVLKNVSFVVPAGKTIAFVGATGSGKSTVTRLMFRFYDVASGAIRVDDMDIRDVTQKSLRTAVGMVPQDTVLFNDTIMMNIRYGRLSATDQEVYAVAEAACIHEAITTRFPKGYQTMVGERGLRLSGGEKQRVAFARALLKNPTILVLDEATSALDTLTERKIQAALVASRAQRTTLIVAHRLSTIVDADMIVVMHLGEVRELGSHTELLAKAGLYAELWHKQLQSSTIDQGEGEHTHIEDVTESASNPAPLPSTASPANGAAASAAGSATPVSSTVAAAEAVQGSPAGVRGESSSRGGRRGGKKK